MRGDWVPNQTVKAAMTVFKEGRVELFMSEGGVRSSKIGSKKYDLIGNAAGPWPAQINEMNKVDTKFHFASSPWRPFDSRPPCIGSLSFLVAQGWAYCVYIALARH